MILCLLALACAPEPADVRVLAGAGLSDALPHVAATWPGGSVEFSFDATSRLARQLEAGAPADVFFAADTQWMDWLQERDLVLSDSRVDLLENSLVVVVPATRTEPLVLEEVDRLALAGAEVPAGRYARRALQASGQWSAVQERVVEGSTVRTVLAWVARAEVDAGLVYASDAVVEPRVKVVEGIDSRLSGPVIFPAGLVPGHGPLAADFMLWCASEPAGQAWQRKGFSLREQP